MSKHEQIFIYTYVYENSVFNKFKIKSNFSLRTSKILGAMIFNSSKILRIFWDWIKIHNL